VPRRCCSEKSSAESAGLGDSKAQLLHGVSCGSSSGDTGGGLGGEIVDVLRCATEDTHDHALAPIGLLPSSTWSIRALPASITPRERSTPTVLDAKAIIEKRISLKIVSVKLMNLACNRVSKVVAML
jgi:hypothetical protein